MPVTQRTCVDCGLRPATPRYVRCFPCRYATWPSRKPTTRRVGDDPVKIATGLRRRVLRAYGLTQDDYDRMLEEQGGGCAVCGVAPQDGGGKPNAEGVRSLFVDHDHATAEVRGLLCLRCNAAIGHMKDEPDRLRAAAEYLERYERKPPPLT